MAKVIHQRTYALPGYEGLTEEAFWQDVNWQRDKKAIADTMVAPFKAAVIASKPHTLEEVVKSGGKITDPVTVGGLIFQVVSRRQAGRTTVDLVGGLEAYIGVIKDRKLEEEKLEAGLRTIDGETYVSVDLLLDKIERNGAQKTAPGLQQVMEFETGAPPAELTRAINRDYGILTPENAQAYAQAAAFVKECDARQTKWRAALEADTLEVWGSKPDKDSRIAVVEYEFDNVAFESQVEYREQMAPATVISKLTKPVPKRITTKSTMGDLTMAKAYPEMKAAFAEKDIGTGIMPMYNPVVRDGLVYVKLEAVEQRLTQIKTACTSSHYEQNIWVRGS